MPGSVLASFISKKSPARLILITGPSGSGKTTCCSELVSQAGDIGLSVGGILCPAIFEGGIKVAIDQLDISSGERQRLGVHSYDSSDSTVGCWHMDESVIARGNEILADLKNEDVIIIDELGPLELEEGYGYQQALCLLDEGRYRVAFVVVRPALIPSAVLRWPQAQIFSLEGEAE